MPDNPYPAEVKILEAVEQTLGQHGRPRKNPGRPRPTAVLTNGKTIPKVTPRHIPTIKQLSLPGAFRYVEITGKYGKTQTEKAKLAFYEAHTGQNGFAAGKLETEIIRIDQKTSDSRKIIRSLKAARKKLLKSALLS